MESKQNQIIGFLAVLFFTFGITYLDFNNLNFADNIRPYIMLLLGVATIAYWLKLRAKAE